MQYPQPGYRIAANIWNLDIPYRSNVPGPMASFLRHVATMQTPENPSYSQGGPQPVQEARDFQREATLANVADHQLYLEKLQFELNTPRLWSSGIQEEIMEEDHKVRLQLGRMIRELQRSNTAQPWVEGWQVASQQFQPPPAPPAAASSTSLPVKAPPAPRAVPTQSSSMASAPRDPPFPAEQGADPWARPKPSQK